MKSLLDYKYLVNDVFYRCWPILEYIEKHPNMAELEREAIKATIMDALVYKKLIDPEKESLDLDNVCIREDLDHYRYELHPNICGIPQWMKEAFRHKSIMITAGLPISLFLAKPPSKVSRYCVYDPNTAVSSIFPDATFYEVFYTSPTRGIRIEKSRPFVEVEIDGVSYLVDTLTKRIIKSSFFKENYGFDIVDEMTVSKLNRQKKEIYEEQTQERNGLYRMLPFFEMTIEAISEKSKRSEWAEMIYEFEKSKANDPESVKEATRFMEVINGSIEDAMKYEKELKERGLY